MRDNRLGPDPDARCLVVGGCGGIGRSYVEGLLAAGARVAVLDLRASLASASLPKGVLTVEADARDDLGLAEAVRSVGGAWGGLDVFTYVSGINGTMEPVERVALASVRDLFEVNLVAAFAASQAAMPFLRQSIAGVMLFVSSGLSANAEAGFGAYAASKAGMNGLMKVLAREGAPSIRANAIAPAIVETAFLTGGTAAGGGTAGAADGFIARLGEQGQRILASIPLGRVAQPDDIAAPMLFLSGPASRFMTGQIIHVNGGRYTP